MTRPDNPRSGERGSALMVVIIVLLVLSAIGMAVILTMEEERGTTYDEMYAQDALYAAEIGLRQGEQALLAATVAAADALLGTRRWRTPSRDPTQPAFPQSQREYDLAHLGTYLTPAGVELANQEVALPRRCRGASRRARSTASTSATTTATSRCSTATRPPTPARTTTRSSTWCRRLGAVRRPGPRRQDHRGGVLLGVLLPDPSGQKLSNAGGTGSGQFGG